MNSVIDIHAILKLMPHRFPFLLIDKVMKIEKNQSLIALKNVSINEPFFSGHFPEQPVMPGVLIIEALAQAGGILAYLSANNKASDGVIHYFAGIDKARFKRVVQPGDQLMLHINVLRTRQDTWKLSGNAYVDNELACSAEFLSMAKKTTL